MTRREIVTLAILIAIMPPIWAVASPHIGNSVGPIALIAAGIYGTNGNRFEDAHRIAAGYIAGDIWALIATLVMSRASISPDVALFLVLAVLGFLAVVISNAAPKIFHMPSWLAGWAIGMLTMNLDKTTPIISLTLQIGAAMLVGVYYVGALVDKVHRIINSRK